MRECIPPNLHDPQRAKGPLDRRSKWFSLVTFFLQKKKVTRAGARNAPSCARHFLIRCRSPNCASTVFRCRCLLLRQKLFVLPRRRLLYPVPNGHTYPLRCSAPQWARFDNRQKRPAHQPLPSLHQRQRRKRYKQSPEPTTIPTAPIPRDQHRQFCITHSAPRDP